MDLTNFGFFRSSSKHGKKDEETKDKKEKKKEYEKKRKRKFQVSWIHDCPGLVYEKAESATSEGEPDAKMFCKICRNNEVTAVQSCSMFLGTNAFRKDTLSFHWKSQAHIKFAERQAVKLRSEKTQGSNLVGPIVECVRKMDSNLEEQIKKLLNTAYFVCKEEMPFTSYATLIKLQEKNGLDVGGFYRSDNACRRFVKYIYEVMYERSVQKIAEKNFFSVLIDGATDSSVTENELVYVSFVNGGVPENHYLSIEDIQNANAQGILNCIDKSFERAKIADWKSNLVGFGSDGASVNLGCKGGVAALLKNEVPHLVNIHCIAHRLELAANDAIKSQKIMKDIQDVLTNTYKQYHHSPKALRELRDIADALEEKVLKPTNLHGTRWLPHVQKALTVLLKNFTVIITHFDHIRGGRIGNAEVQGRATNISKKLKDYPFLYMSFFMLDVLKTLSMLSLKVQKDNTTLSQFLESITVLHFSLTELKQTNGEDRSKFTEKINGDVFHNITLQNVNCAENYSAKREEIINILIEAIDKRFAPMEKDPILKAAATLLDLTEYPNTREELALFGVEQLHLLMQHFVAILQNADCDVAVVGDETKAFKAHVHAHKTTAIENYFQSSDLGQRFENYLMLVEILLALPISSAACERGFSYMKSVKSDWRSSLAPSMLRMLMYISIEGCPFEEFNSIPVLDRWWGSGRAKRPGFNPFDFRGESDSD